MSEAQANAVEAIKPDTGKELSPEQLAERVERVLIKGDLSGITQREAIVYYRKVCDSIGINPYTNPFSYLRFQGKLILYANKNCTDQLRFKYKISVTIVGKELKDGMLTVHASARTPAGRVDEDYGVVPLSDKVQGEIRSNLTMKAVTKAKRRVTLSICGLSMLDESEVDSLPAGAERVPDFPTPTYEDEQETSG